MAAYQLVRNQYQEPGRHYHTLEHIRECLRIFDYLSARAPIYSSNGDPDAVELALWFHDAYYDSRASDNEERSAQFAGEILATLGCTKKTIHEVQRLVMATTHQRSPRTATARIVCDIDLAILGSEPEKYDQYARQIRREYAWVPLDRYREGRISFLQRLLAGPGIYRTEELANLERPARSNIERELANLNGSV
jgi:predicted metal-dependent HD superfamily phosphohydrolase